MCIRDRSSTFERILRISSSLMLHFFYLPCTSRENWVRTMISFKLAIEIFSIRKTRISHHFDNLSFSLDKKFTDDVILSQADMLTGCPLTPTTSSSFERIDAWFVAIRPVCHEKLGWGWPWPFRRRWRFFILCTRHACGRVHSIFFCRPSFGVHTHLL